MIPENGNIVVGVSGGADSVCLLRALTALRERYGLHLTAVHVNHRIRSEAGQDAAFVEALCREWKVPFVLVEEDVEALAAREHLSCEEAGRKVRYEAFARELAEMDAAAAQGRTADSAVRGCIAVAHNSDDRAETLLFHLFRGTGLNGMAGIRPVRQTEDGGRIIRPLLFCTREEIERFLRQENLCWCTDATNGEDLYARNRIRNRILPYAQQEICERAKDHLAREAQLLADTSDFVERMAREAMKRCCVRGNDGGLVFETAQFLKEDPFLQRQMVWQGLAEVGTGKDLTSAHVEQAWRLFGAECQSGRKMEVPACGVRVMRQFSQVVMEPMGAAAADSAQELYGGGETDALAGNTGIGAENAAGNLTEGIPLTPGSVFVPGLGLIEAKILEVSGESGGNPGQNATFLQDIPEKTYTKWFDYDKIIESVVVRTRQVGDYLTINGSGAKKSLKRYLIEEKIPAHRRDEVLLLADGAHVMWVPGHRISAAYKVTAQTKRIFQVSCPECERQQPESGQ